MGVGESFASPFLIPNTNEVGLCLLSQALEEGEDIQELSERAREKKERRAQNKVTRDAESNSPAPDFDTPRARKSSKKGKSRAGDLEVSTPAPNGKRKRAAAGGKSTSMTHSLIDDEDNDTATVGGIGLCVGRRSPRRRAYALR